MFTTCYDDVRGFDQTEFMEIMQHGEILQVIGIGTPNHDETKKVDKEEGEVEKDRVDKGMK